MQPSPSVNAVLTFDPDAMIEFVATKNFDSFTQNRSLDPNVHLFSNAPNSNLLSLTHSVGMDQPDQTMELELIDPQGVFEEALLNVNLEDMWSLKDNPVSKILKQKMDQKEEAEGLLDAAKKELKRLNHTINSTQHSLDNAKMNVKRRSVELKVLHEEAERLWEDMGGRPGRLDQDDWLNKYDKKATEAQLIKSQYDAATSYWQRPLYISYGIGNDLGNWSPPICFERILKIEYVFNATGARVLKLKMVGIGVHPNLTSTGLKPFGPDMTKGLVTTGQSWRLFNKEASKIQVNLMKKLANLPDEPIEDLRSPTVGGHLPYFPDREAYNIQQDIEGALGDPYKPSFHWVVKKVLESFLRKGIGPIGGDDPNVLVLFPNLDEFLANYLSRKRASVKASINKSDEPGRLNNDKIIDFLTFKAALEGIGLSLGLRYPEEKAQGSATSNKAAVNKTRAVQLGQPPKEGSRLWVDGLWGEHYIDALEIVAMLECDHVTTPYAETIVNVGNAIQTLIRDYYQESVRVNFMQYVQLETDFNMLRIMKKAQLIERDDTPCYIYGDSIIITDYLRAALLEWSVTDIHSKGKLSPGEVDLDDPVLTQEQLESFTNNYLTKFVNPLDVIVGLNLEYMKEVVNYAMPPQFPGAFGERTLADFDESALPHDANRSKLDNKKKVHPFLASRMPVFSFGTKSPNIIGVEFDFDSFFTGAMAKTATTPIIGHQMKSGLIPDRYTGKADRLFQRMKNWSDNWDEEMNVPVDFMEYVEKYYVTSWLNTRGGIDLKDQKWLKEAFTNLGIEDMVSVENFGVWTFMGGKKDFYQYMWRGIEALFDQSNLDTYSTRNVGSTSMVDSLINRHVALSTFIINNVFTGVVTTLPMFNLSTLKRVMNRPCLLYCVEPQFMHNSEGKKSTKDKPNLTWFTAMYMLTGFKHTINSTNVESEFLITKDPSIPSKLSKIDYYENLEEKESEQNKRKIEGTGSTDPNWLTPEGQGMSEGRGTIIG